MLGIVPGKRRQGGQKKRWMDDIVQWGERSLVEMVKQAEKRKKLPVLSPWSRLHRARQADDDSITVYIHNSQFQF